MAKIVMLLKEIIPTLIEDELLEIQKMVENELKEKNSEWLDQLVQEQLKKENN